MDSSDDDFEHVSDVDMCDSDSERPNKTLDSAPSSPPSLRNSQRKTLACSYQGCHKTFNRKSRLEEHIRSHENIRPFKCPYAECDAQPYLRQSHLNAHIKSVHTGVRDYVCTWEDCDKSFANGTRLRRHIAAHQGREKYRCRGYVGCSEVFRKHETLKKHILSVHQQMRPYPCTETDSKTGNQCAKAFDTMEKLRAHQRALHDPQRYACVDCLAQNTDPATGEYDNTSDGDAHFATYSDLQAHIADVHPPTCQYCPTSFKTLRELSRHLEIQHGYVDPNLPYDSTFTCDHIGCDRVFTKKGNLNVHIKTVHEKKKDFVCGETIIPLPKELAGRTDIEVYGCGREFSAKATLEDHVRSAHLGLPKLLLEARKKRKADSNNHCQDEFEGEDLKKKPRKDKGIKKSSTIAAITGYPLCQKSAKGAASPQLPTAEMAASKVEDENEADDWNQLSGSMVMFGDHIYHNGQQYQYNQGQYLPGMSPRVEATENHRYTGTNEFDNTPTFTYPPVYDEEPIFENFEHEPELMTGLGKIDPVLLQS